MNSNLPEIIVKMKNEFGDFDEKFHQEVNGDDKFEWVDLKSLKKYINYFPEYFIDYYYEIAVRKNDLDFFIHLWKAKKEYFDQRINDIFEDIATIRNSYKFLYFLLNNYNFTEDFLYKITTYTVDSANYYDNMLFLLKSDKVNVSYNGNNLFSQVCCYVGDNRAWKFIFENPNFDINNNKENIIKYCLYEPIKYEAITYLVNNYKEETFNDFINKAAFFGKNTVLDFLISEFNLNTLEISEHSLMEIIQQTQDYNYGFIKYLINKKEYIRFLSQFLNENNKFTPYLLIKYIGSHFSIDYPEYNKTLINNINKFIISEKVENF